MFLLLCYSCYYFNLGKDVVEGMENQHKHNDTHHGKGVKKDDIPEGDEDLYLKSEIVPPVCPKCPDAAVCPRKTFCTMRPLSRTRFYMQKGT